jgi:hypothetical protein
LILPKIGCWYCSTETQDHNLNKYSALKIKTDTSSKYLKKDSYSPKKFFSVSRIIATTFKPISIEIK